MKWDKGQRLGKWLNPELEHKISFVVYRYRFIAIYILIGVLSLLLEFALRVGILAVGGMAVLATGFGAFCGILFAFWGNVQLNFKVPLAKRRQALLYFFAISVASGLVQLLVKEHLLIFNSWSYEEARVTISGSFFLISYLFHRRYSFRDYKRVGVAVYANGVEDIQGIFEKIGQYPDFIHVDIADGTFSDMSHDVRTYRMEVIRAYWSSKEIHAHIMSSRPSHWLPEILSYSDLVIVHAEIDEELKSVLRHIRQKGCRAGLCLTMKTPLATVLDLLGEIDELMLLTIPTPGLSGQQFDVKAFEKIDQINELTGRSRLRVCIDGGVNERIVGLLNVEDVVSGSSVLKSQKPRKQIMRMQTSSRYEST